MQGTYLLAAARGARLYAVAALDDVCLERDGSWAAVKLEEKAACIAEDRTGFIAAPERSGAGGAVLADGLRKERLAVTCSTVVVVWSGRLI